MGKKFNAIGYAIIAGLILYILDAIIFYFLFGNELTFIQALITKVPLPEVYNRLLMLTGVIILGLIINGKVKELLSENIFLEKQSIKNLFNQSDNNPASTLASQIRIPLNAIIGFSDLLKNPDLSPENKKLYLQLINSSSNFLLLLINNTSDIKKIESNDFSINRTECNINKIIENLFRDFQARKEEIGKSNIPLVIEKGDIKDGTIILTDPERLKLVLINLLENSFDHTVKGMVKLGYTIKENGFIEFYINDTGPSLSRERLEIVLNRYNKLTDNKYIPFNEFEIRLAVSKSMVKLLGGDIRTDRRPVEGNTIYFTIPFIEVEKKEEAIPGKTLPSISREWEGRQILIAEDVESNYIYLEELLRPTKIRVFWAKNGKEAINLVKNNPDIELVLMDIVMPVMDGYDAAKEIKKIRKDLPVIAQTAYLIEDNWDSEENKDFDNYLIKPIWAPQLISAIDTYIF